MLYQNIYAVDRADAVDLPVPWGRGEDVLGAFGLQSISLADFVAISVVGGGLSSVVVGVFTIALSRHAFRRSWDLDSVAAP